MAKILGLNKTNTESGHWFGGNGEAYSHNNDVIESITDPNKGTGITQPTAIPSPFARIDLTKNAFRKICDTKNLKAQDNKATIDDEKLVSDALDLAELLFNQDLIQKALSISYWDKNLEITKLSNGSKEHKRIAEALQLYLSQDATVYNFDIFDGMHIIKYNGQVIGGTSPSTLFFSSGNDLSSLQIKLTTNDILFDNLYNPLYNRDPEFQKYFYALFYQDPVLQARMKEMHQYLINSLNFLKNKDAVLANEIRFITENPCTYTNDYLPMAMSNAGDNMCVFKGVEIRKQNGASAAEDINTNSDFRINSSKKINGNTPLVLATGNAYDTWKYVKGTWDANTKVPVNNGDIKNRILPDTQIEYPFLGVNDFLEESIIQLPAPLNKKMYFSGNVDPKLEKDFLLPLKPLFFEYFDVKDLEGASGPKIKIEGASYDIIVTLEIPVKANSYVIFTKKYKKAKQGKDEDNALAGVTKVSENSGSIYPAVFSLAIFPHFQLPVNLNIENYFRVQLIDDASENNGLDLNLSFYQGSSVISPRIERNREDDKNILVTKHYALNENFDYIRINSEDGTKKGIAIPIWSNTNNQNKEFTFAIDFGTTNTHIEYKVGDEGTKAFTIGNDKKHVGFLLDTTMSDGASPTIFTYLEDEFIPETIGGDKTTSTGYKGSYYSFPTRTAICKSENTASSGESIVDLNIAFPYFKRSNITSKVEPNLKWSSNPKAQQNIIAYFESIIILIRNKVLLEGGDLERTKIIWFYPSSMIEGRIDAMKNDWNTLYNRFINKNANIETTAISESIAPFYYYFKTRAITGNTKPVVTIDIGGGTSDVVVFQDNKPLFHTSFMFAANSIFGDGYAEELSHEASKIGFRNRYLETIKDTLKNNSLFSPILGQLEKKSSSELNAFLFSISGNKDLNFSYNNLISRDETVKIVFIYFYVAQLYHIAQLFKRKNITKPKDILYSGNGSKLLNIISTNNDRLSEIANIVFDVVLGKDTENYSVSIKIEKEIPKELTCKGGLLIPTENIITKAELKKIECIQTESSKDEITLNNIESFKSNEIKDNITFNTVFIKIAEDNDFEEKFNIPNDAFNLFKEELKDTSALGDNLNAGINAHIRQFNSINRDRRLTETMFFYPIVCTIQNAINKLCELNDYQNRQ